MGLFGNMKSNLIEKLNPQNAVMIILIKTMAADGEIEPEEISQLNAICCRSPLFSQNTKEEDDHLIDFAIRMLQQEKENALTLAAAQLTPELQETAFALSTDIVLADGVVTDEEEAFIEQLGSDLQVGSEAVKAIVYTTIARNRGL